MTPEDLPKFLLVQQCWLVPFNYLFVESPFNYLFVKAPFNYLFVKVSFNYLFVKATSNYLLVEYGEGVLHSRGPICISVGVLLVSRRNTPATGREREEKKG